MINFKNIMLTGGIIIFLLTALPCQAQKSYGNIALFHTTDTLHGMGVSILSNRVRSEMRGVCIGGTINAIDGDMRGLQMSLISNIAKKGHGVQIAGLTNATTTPFRGIQLGGITNIAMGMKRGMQIAAAANICSSYMRGLQMAGYNYADTLNGWQIGITNVCVSHPRGVQVGLINYSRDTIAHKIGLVNINPKTRIDFMAYAGSSTKMNVAVRFRNRSTYNILGVGTHYWGLGEKFSGALFYRIGQYFQITPKWSLSGDLGYYHIESFQEASADKPERLFSIQGRINADYQLSPHSSIFTSIGYGDTRYYHHEQKFRQRLIVEAGLAWRLQRKTDKDSY